MEIAPKFKLFKNGTCSCGGVELDHVAGWGGPSGPGGWFTWNRVLIQVNQGVDPSGSEGWSNWTRGFVQMDQ